jgi:transposase
MGKTKDITPRKASVVIAYANDGISYKKIAEKLKISKATVGRIVKRHQEMGSSNHRRGSGRPRKTSPRDDNATVAHLTPDPLQMYSVYVIYILIIFLSMNFFAS